jgi:Domain of unknown function (DUF4335)
MFNSVLRRYTPPTCTLEITAKGSPLSQWIDRPVLRQLEFHLSFDDPKLPVDQQVKLQGDRSQLESLSSAVSNYVQTFLMQSPTEFEELDWENVNQNGKNSVLATALQGARADLTQGEFSFLDFEEEQIQIRTPEDSVGDTIHPAANAGIALKPKGLLTHDLLLGTLATAESGSAISLSAVQLFDLANVLDEYTAEVLTLPALSRPWFRSQPGMLSIAAATLLAFGVTASLLKFVMDMNAPVQTATSLAAPETGLLDQQVAIAPNSPQISGTKPPPPVNFAPPNPLRLPPPPNATAFPNNAGPTSNPSIPRASLPPRQPLPPIVVAPAPRAAQTQIPIQPVAPENPATRTNSQDSIVQRNADAQTSTDELQTSGAPGARLAPPNPASTESTAFDTIPQVAEARAYFQQRWQPPAGLNQTLEYRLQVGADGTIQQIVPLGQAAGDYVDRTQIPLIGEPFVSPLQSGDRAEIRLVLSPNGRVRTFLEAPNQ